MERGMHGKGFDKDLYRKKPETVFYYLCETGPSSTKFFVHVLATIYGLL